MPAPRAVAVFDVEPPLAAAETMLPATSLEEMSSSPAELSMLRRRSPPSPGSSFRRWR